MTFLKSLKIYILSVPVIIAASLLGMLLLVAAFKIPLDPVLYADSWNVSNAEGWYPDVLEATPSLNEYFTSLRPGIGSAANDKQMMEIAAGLEGKSAFDQAMKMYMDGEPYDRYWHGYVAVLRPLMRLLHYREIRFLNIILQMGLMFLAVFAVTSRLGKKYGMLLFSQYILLMPAAIGMYICISAGYYIAMAGTLVLLYFGEKFEKRERFLLLFLVIGMCSGYFEQLSYNLITWGMPALWGLLMYGEKRTSKDNAVRLIESGIMWAFGYLGIWAMKLVWLSMYKGTNAFMEASGSADMWAGGSLLETFAARFKAHYINWEHYAYELYAVILLIWLVVIIFRFFTRNRVKDSRRLSLALIVMSAIGWYFVMYKHTIGHQFVTYRIYNTSVAALIAFWLVSYTGKTAFHKSSFLKKFIAFLPVFFIAAVLALSLREECRETNSGEANRIYSPVPDNSQVRLAFTPPGKKVLSIGFGVLLPEGVQSFPVRVYDNGTEVAKTTIASDEISDVGFVIHDVNWELRSGYTYEMALDLPDGSSVMLLPTADNTIPSFTGLYFGDTAQPTQPIAWIDYMGRPGKRCIMVFAFAFLLLFGMAVDLSLPYGGKKR